MTGGAEPSVGDLATLPGDGLPSAPEAPEPSEEVVPERFGRFAVRGVLGKGGMSTVLEAYDESLDREIALKVLHHGIGPTSRSGTRLVREAQALARLSHPNVVHVYEVGEVEGQTFIAMELIRGRTLQQWQAPRPSWRECVEIYIQAGRGLVAAHAVGLVHRDFKPSNCIVDDEGQVRVLDFGLAREQVRGRSDDDYDPMSPVSDVPVPDARTPEVSSSLTQTGAVLGTLAYMPLEQLDGAQVDERSDQFSLCVSLYEALYGERPFPDESVGRLTTALMQGTIRPAPPGAVVPARLRRIVLRGLATEPERRWPSVEALLDELSRMVAPRRGRWIALALGGGLLMVGGGLWKQTREDERCAGSRDELAGVWDSTRAEEVEAALRATRLPYADSTWAGIRPRLDEYADAWVEQHRDACEATVVRGAQTETMMNLRMGCLSTRRLALREVVDVLAQADAGVAEQAVSIVAGLPGLSRCDDEEALQADLEPPEDPVVATRASELRERLAGVRPLIDAGLYPAAQAELDALMEQVESVGYGPLMAEASVLRGDLRAKQARYAEAEDDLTRAYALAIEHGHERVAIEASKSLVYVVGTMRARYGEGHQWALSAQAWATRGEPRDEAGVLDLQGGLMKRQGKYDSALELQQRALAIRERLGQDDPELADTLSLIGQTLAALGRHTDALDHHRRSLLIRQRTLGADHPSVAGTLLDLGAIVELRGQLGQALEYYREARSIRERTLGPDHFSTGVTVISIGSVLGRQEHFDEAMASYRRGLAIFESAVGPDHPDVAGARINFGVLLQRQGLYDEAIEQYQRAREPLVKSAGREHPHVAIMLDNLGAALQEKERYTEALPLHQEALAIRKKVLGPEHPDVARATANAGRCLVRLGRVEEGLVLQREALVLFEKVWGAGHDQVATALLLVAESERLAGRAEDAVPMVERALGILETIETNAWQRATAYLTGVRCLTSAGLEDRERAVVMARRSKRLFVEAGREDDERMAEVVAWLEEHDREEAGKEDTPR